MPRRRNDDWIAALLALGIGYLALQFLSKSSQSVSSESKICSYCGYESQKWARMCSRCRNTFSI